MVVIVISGRPGAGKTTAAKKIAEAFNLKYVSAGNLVRKIARKMGFGTKGKEFLKFHEYMEKHREIDKLVDEEIIKAAKEGNVVIEGWLAGQIVKNADIKIYLKVPLEIASKRISQRERIKKGALETTLKRERSNEKRWKRIYGIDINNLNPYNLVIDTSLFNIKETEQIIKFVCKIIVRKRRSKK